MRCTSKTEFERAMIRERVRAGLARAKAQGVRLGRPHVDAEREVRIWQPQISQPCPHRQVAQGIHGCGIEFGGDILRRAFGRFGWSDP
jgi:hypothetical protein